MTAGYRAVESMSRSDCAHFVAPTRPSRHLPRTPTVSDAIGDLPSLDGCRLPAPPSPYAAALCGVLPLHDHIGRVPSERDRRIFGLMESGDDYRHANMIAVRLLHEEIARRGLTDIAEIDALRKDYCPPYDPAKFRDAWRRLDGSKPSHVLTAHLAHDTYSAIHYAEARTLTVREVARLQGVPDDFLLTASGASMSASFRMLGNGVGIHAGRAVAAALIAQIRQAVRAPVVAASRDRFRVMADRRFLPRSSAVAFAAHPDLWASPQAYADAKADRREAGIPDIADADAERMGLVLTPCKVGWMRRGFDAWIGRERLPTLAAYLDDLDGTPYAEWEARRRRKPDMAAAE